MLQGHSAGHALAEALTELERAIDQVQRAATLVAASHGSHVDGLSCLDLVQAAVRRARGTVDEERRCPSADPPVQGSEGGVYGVYTEAAQRTRWAQDALWDVRKSLRRAPARAVERLAAVDLEGVDPQITQQVYGEWLRQCARLGLPETYKYHAAFGRGAVLVRCEGATCYRVVSSIGLPGWPPGTLVASAELPGLQPLR